MAESGMIRTPPTTQSALRVFLADDHAVVQAGLKTLIEAQTDMRVVGQAQNGKIAWEGIKALQSPGGAGVDVVVMDVSMPEWNGVQATTQIKRDWPQMRVLALSMHEDKSYLRSLLEAGASGYVLKRSAAEELIRAIRIIAVGGVYLDPSLSATVTEALIRGNGDSSLRATSEGNALSEREEEVIKLIAQGFTNKEIGVKLFLSVKTVETYKARSLEKLGMGSRADLVRYAIAKGWMTQDNTHF